MLLNHDILVLFINISNWPDSGCFGAEIPLIIFPSIDMMRTSDGDMVDGIIFIYLF